MTLNLDPVAAAAYAGIPHALRAERLRRRISQAQVAAGLPVRGRANCEWETGAVQPTLDHLILWAASLEQRLALVDARGQVGPPQVRQRPGETWTQFERRRLAVPLRLRRQAMGIAQEEIGRVVGVSRDSVCRWERATAPPWPANAAVWAQTLGYTLTVRPVGT